MMMALLCRGRETGETRLGECRMTQGTAFHQTGIMERHQFGIMGNGRNAKPLCALMKLRVELLESFGKRLLQLL